MVWTLRQRHSLSGYCDNRSQIASRFDSPELHEEVDVSEPRFPAPTIRRQLKGL
jgi:hypothetical protein